MYHIYNLYSFDEDEVHVVYSKQDCGQKYSALKRNADNGMEGEIYDCIRKAGKFSSCLQRNNYYSPYTKNKADTLEQAKIYRIEVEKSLKDYRIKENKKTIEELKEDNEELEKSKLTDGSVVEQTPEVNIKTCKAIEENIKKILRLKNKIEKLLK